MAESAHVAASHGAFNRIRQVAPICKPSIIWFLGLARESTPRMVSRSV